ncbi:MAG: amidohydrolase family protein [Leptolinea sp.]|jgi:predicted TIM-barrel fold metal-dependent hydrolase|nr:amidohydrolase family protein [Leptolinea sp.]
MIIDFLSHTGTRKGYNYPVEELITMMDGAGVDRAMTASQLENIDNENTALSVKKFPDRIIGFAVENPWTMGAEEDLEHALRDNGLKGLKLNANRFGFAADRHSIVDPFFQICSRYHAAVMAHAMSDLFSIPAKWEEIARSFPDVPIVLSHMGIPMMADNAFEIAKRNKNIYLGTAVCFAPVVKRAIEEVGPEKVIFSSDAPFGSMAQEIRKIKYVTSDPGAQKLILGENARKILNL